MQQTVCRACFNQRSVRTVRQKVVFMIHPDRYKAHAKAVLEYEKKVFVGTVQKRSSPVE